MCSAMESLGFRYLNVADFPTDWARSVAAAEAVATRDQRALKPCGAGEYQLGRLQLRFKGGWRLPQFDPSSNTPADRCRILWERETAMSCRTATLSPRKREEARAPQRLHMDAVKAFPVAALLPRWTCDSCGR